MFSKALGEQSGDSACVKSVHWQKHKLNIFSFVKQSYTILKCKKAATANPSVMETFEFYILIRVLISVTSVSRPS